MLRSRAFSIGCAGILLCIVGAAVGCSSQPAPAEGQTGDKSTAPMASTEVPSADAGAAPSDQPSAAPEPQPTEPVPAASREPPAPTPPVANASAASSVTDPGGAVEVAATKPGLSRIGADKCKMCHKVQFASWSESAHAKRTPALDCESCHGAGSEYKTLAVMKDPEKARAAGLVIPDAAFCSTCHTAGVNDELRKRAHAHKTPAGS